MVQVASTTKMKNQDYSVASPSGRKISYRLAGRCGPEDPTVLFVHGMAMAGMGATWAVFAKQAVIEKGKPKKKPEEMLDELPWTIVVADRGGYQKSTLNKKAADWTLDDSVIDYVAVLDDLKVEKVALQAGSTGGAHALHLAYKHPERVSAIFLNCCDANYAPGFPKGKKSNEDISKGEPVTYTDGSAMMRPGAGCTRCFLCYNPCCCCCCCCPKGLHADISLEIKPQPYKYEDIRCPVIVVGGLKDDTVDPNCSRYHASQLPNASLEMVDGMGHCLMPAELFKLKMSQLHNHATGTSVAPGQAVMS
mmetsp:Transcript_25693/g.58426  ORF Transcript_25693/g.58426 Transcript_25693/m.58426 type:complete len:307 (-) Transcript_25693:80-1000(-)